MFYSFDGIDGAGKSTQVRLFCDWLASRGHDVVACRDPGGTRLGEAVRELLLDPGSRIGRRAEMLLYMACRAQLVDDVIAPALSAGKTVVSDRFLLSNVVYQGHAGGLDVPRLWQIGDLATGGLQPDLTFVLDLSPEAASARIQRARDRMESQGDNFIHRLREGFLAEARRHADRIALVDASASESEVHAAIVAAAEARRKQNSPASGDTDLASF